MLFYFKDRKTFITKAVCEGINYKLVESVWTDLSEITCTNNDAVQGDEFVFTDGGWIALLTSVEHNQGAMTVKAEKIERLVRRDICFIGFGASWPCEQTALYYLQYNFIMGDDPMYNLPYLTRSRETLEAGACLPRAERGVFNLQSYFALIRRLQNVFVYFDVQEDILNVRIRHESRQMKTLVTTNVPCEVVEESFGGGNVAKVSTYVYAGGEMGWLNENELTHWYLFEDGTVSNDPSAGVRVEGDWKLLAVEQADDPEIMAKNEFKQNSYTHKVIVRVPDDKAIYNFFDPVRVEVNNHVYMSYVSRKTRTSEGYTEYTFGDLKTSLMDKINEEE